MNDIRKKAIKYEAEMYGFATNPFVDGFVNGYQQGYNDAIEECIKHIKLYKYNDGTYVVYDEILDEIAEQMRKGKENESSD